MGQSDLKVPRISSCSAALCQICRIGLIATADWDGGETILAVLQAQEAALTFTMALLTASVMPLGAAILTLAPRLRAVIDAAFAVPVRVGGKAAKWIRLYTTGSPNFGSWTAGHAAAHPGGHLSMAAR